MDLTPNIPSTPQAGLIDSTDGTPKIVFTRRAIPMPGPGSLPFLQLGGFTARDRSVAASILTQDFFSNSNLHAIAETIVTNTLGTGLTLSATPDLERFGVDRARSRQLSHDIERAWEIWSRNPDACDAVGISTVDEIVNTAFHEWLLNGEIVLGIDAARGGGWMTKAALFASAQLDSMVTRVEDGRYVLNGVAFNATGRVIGYYIRQAPLGNIAATTPIAKYVAKQTRWGRTKLAHIYERIDARQVRGISPLAAAIAPAIERELLHEMTSVNAQLQTAFAATLTSEMPPEAALGSIVADEHRGSIDPRGMEERAEFYKIAPVDLKPGKIAVLAPGDKLELLTAKNPHNGYVEYDRSLSRKAARAAGSSYEDASGDYSQTTFSASRMAAELPHRLTLRRRKMIVERVYQEIYGAFLEEAVSSGAVRLPDGVDFYQARAELCQAKWRGIGRVEPDVLKATEAKTLRLVNGLTTFSEALAEEGIDFERHVEALAAEREHMNALGLNHPFGQFATQAVDQNRVQEDETNPAQPKTPTPPRNAPDEEDGDF